MNKPKLFICITVFVAFSVALMQYLFVKHQNLRDATIHIVQSFSIGLSPENLLLSNSTVSEIVDSKSQNLTTTTTTFAVKQRIEKKETQAIVPISLTPPPLKALTMKKEESKPENICDKNGKGLVGPLAIDQRVPEMEDVIKEFSVTHGGWVEKGGKWKPKDCKPRTKVAIVIPFRKREAQLKIFLKHLHPILHRQLLQYQIFVVEQSGDDPFNRAGLFNIGFTEALKMNDFDCFVFSDVDLLPEDDRNNYGCPTSPRHMSVAVDKFNYRLPYEGIFGGVGAFKRADFEKINGFSNKFWGWGGEDDDLFARIHAKGFKLTRPSMTFGRYTMIKVHHFQSHAADPNRFQLLQNPAARMSTDGLNTLKYKLDKTIELPLVTIFNIQLSKSMYPSPEKPASITQGN